MKTISKDDEYIPDGKKEKRRKAFKNHVCSCCDEFIKKGEFYVDGSIRQPKLDDDGNQVGIEFVKWKLHINPNQCENVLSKKGLI
jgi:hypothetical protein